MHSSKRSETTRLFNFHEHFMTTKKITNVSPKGKKLIFLAYNLFCYNFCVLICFADILNNLSCSFSCAFFSYCVIITTSQSEARNLFCVHSKWNANEKFQQIDACYIFWLMISVKSVRNLWILTCHFIWLCTHVSIFCELNMVIAGWVQNYIMYIYMTNSSKSWKDNDYLIRWKGTGQQRKQK